MLRTDEAQRHALIEQAAGLEEATGQDGAGEDAFVQLFYQDVPDEDVVSRTPAQLSAPARSLWRFGADRQPGTPKLQMVTDGPRGVIQIVTDDMPFLVTSIENVLVSMDAPLHLIIHPIVTAVRSDGARVAAAASAAPGLAEAMMHVELADALTRERGAAIAAKLQAVLAEVRSVVAAWAGMRSTARAIADQLDTATGPFSEGAAAEVAAFLRWLEADNFVYLGYRDYRFGEAGPLVVPGSGQGLLAHDDFQVFDGLLAIAKAAPNVQAFLEGPQLLLVTKSSRPSPVYRPVPMDTMLIKIFDAGGKVGGLRLLLGLFTTTSYFHVPQDIPVVRRKVQRAIGQSGFAPASYNRQALQRILEGFPRDELFHIDSDTLFATARGILHLKQRPRIGLFVLHDRFERSATCLVYLPRDRYNAEIRRSFTAILEQAFDGSVITDTTTFDAALACLQVVLATTVGHVPEIDVAALERQLAEAARSWAERLSESLVATHGSAEAAGLQRRFAAAFPAAYIERNTAHIATEDIAFVQQVSDGAPLALALSRSDAELRLKTFHLGSPVALSDILPMLENLGVRVINENPFEVTPRGAEPVWIQEFQLQPGAGLPHQDADALHRFEDALRLVWSGTVEDDGFNRLVLGAGLPARQVVLLRAYCKLLRQAGSSFSQAYMEDTLVAHPGLTSRLVQSFEAQFDPAGASETQAAAIQADILVGLEQVENLDEDRILRSYLLLIRKTLRTNYYQRDGAGAPKSYLSLKIASHDIDLLPLPRPLVEIFVYGVRMEGCHLRGGKVARGGIRWSDRKEDFRTEILGLMKAQMVKNAVIVPIGSKGGFVLKQPPTSGGREALLAEGIACYKLLMAGLLDVTDNFAGADIVPPVDVVRRDADDPYLVVAADKGTATFSDIANGVALERGFWLGDAFASGGSVGYDHKVMGITAKGAWEAVKRHFREIGTNIQTTDFTCVGVGDMAGDVFGNGMLLSRHTRLVAAFNHMHIFIDPNPDAAASWAERQRLFDLPRSSWADYDPAVLSPGGAIYERRAKSITLSAEAQARFGLAEVLSPQALIQALLALEADLLWFGGIGTYVKASTESHADVGDRANDSLRMDARRLRAKVVGEGANLAVTHRARIEYALAGGRINTDAIDNSAGVDTSDHEVNIKIGVGDLIVAGLVPAAERASFLAAMTDEVERLVLVDNILQTLALSLAEARAPQALDAHVRLMRTMERAGRLDRAVEFLPDDEAVARRAAAGRGLTRPEIAVLLAYAKNALYEQLLASGVPDLPEMKAVLLDYFPHAMRTLGPDVLAAHRLRREIIATVLANAVVNRLGPDFIAEMQTSTGRDASAIVRAYVIVCDIFDLASLWAAVEALDNQVPAAAQTQLLLAIEAIVGQAVRWFLLSGLALDIAARTRQFAPGLGRLAASVSQLVPASEQRVMEARRTASMASGAPADLADRVLVLNALGTAMDIVLVSETTGRDIVAIARLYFGAGVSLGLLTLRRQARLMPTATEWQRQVVDTLIDDSFTQQRALVRGLVAAGVEAGDDLERWVAQRSGPGSPIQAVLTDVARTSPPDLAMLTVASQRIRAVVSVAAPT